MFSQVGVDEFAENVQDDTRIPTTRFVPAGCEAGFHEMLDTTVFEAVSKTFERYVAGE
jgi:hypothetical protein